jgi:ribosomal protein S18 acetylase RimI-like enzyme
MTAIESPSHFSRWTIVSMAEEVVGAFVAYPLTDPYKAGDVKDLPDVYTPMLELEHEAVGSWYVMTLSLFPEYRNQGFGTAMLTRVRETAKTSGYDRLSIMVVSDNSDALRLYERFGFAEVARRRFIPFPGSGDKGDWLLLKKKI